MFDPTALNVPAVVVASLVGFALGAAWYSPALLGDQWLAALGKSKDELSGAAPAMAAAMLATLAVAVLLDLLLAAIGAVGAWQGLVVGLYVGLGFVATMMLSDYLFCGYGMKLYMIQAGYRLVLIAVIGAVLGAWR